MEPVGLRAASGDTHIRPDHSRADSPFARTRLPPCCPRAQLFDDIQQFSSWFGGPFDFRETRPGCDAEMGIAAAALHR